MSTPPTPENVAAVDFIAQAQGALANASELPLGDSGESYYVGTAQVHATLAVAERLGKIADLLRPPRTVGDAVRAVGVEGDEAPIVVPRPTEEPYGLDLEVGTVRRKPNGRVLAVLWPSPPHPARWMVTDQWGSCGYETDEKVADWPVVGAVPFSPAAGFPLAPLPAMSDSYAGPEQAERISAALTGQDLKDGAR